MIDRKASREGGFRRGNKIQIRLLIRNILVSPYAVLKKVDTNLTEWGGSAINAWKVVKKALNSFKKFAKWGYVLKAGKVKQSIYLIFFKNMTKFRILYFFVVCKILHVGAYCIARSAKNMRHHLNLISKQFWVTNSIFSFPSCTLKAGSTLIIYMNGKSNVINFKLPTVGLEGIKTPQGLPTYKH
jgi:hypothetical protein